MAQHDYVIANGTGAAVRSDLNNALAAIVSQNSGAVAPTTTYAYMPWADTGSSPPVFKIRNAANNGWITLYELDGTFSIEAGSASSPGLYFTGDTNTGIYSPGADQFGIATGGTSRLVIDASGNINMDSGTVYVDAANNRLGIGTTPTQQLHVRTDQAAYTWARIDNQSSSASAYSGLQLGAFGNSWGLAIGSSAANSNSLTFVTDAGGSNSEKARFTSDGKFLVGTSTSVAVNSAGTTFDSELQVAGSSASVTIARTVGSGSLFLARNQTVNDGSPLGFIGFQGGDGTSLIQAASIQGVVDGTPGANDMPGRLVFSTTADGASSPTERMRITSTGQLRLAGAGITFNGDTATANELDDYEEGTWTPSVGGTATYTKQAGSYTKIGRMVSVRFEITINTLGTGSTQHISGLPFGVGSADTTEGYGAVGFYASLAVNVTSLTCYAAAGSGSVFFNSIGAAGATATNNPAIFGNSARVQGSVIYFTA